jgi:hypothetical protein
MQIKTLAGVLFSILTIVSPCYSDSTSPLQRPSDKQEMRVQQAAEWSVARNWETEVMGVKVRGTAQRRDNEIKGVLYIYPPLSDKWTYHWFGKIEGNKVSASHSDGHSFSGLITPERTVEGVVTTKDGHRIPLKAPLP